MPICFLSSELSEAFQLDFNPQIVFYVLFIVLVGALVIHVRRRMAKWDLGWTYQMAAAAGLLWAIFEVMELMTTSPSGRFFWVKLQSLGFSAAGPTWLYFMLHLVRHPSRRSRWLLAGLLAVYAVCVAMVWTNPLHGRFFVLPSPSPTAPFKPREVFWILLSIQYSLMLTGLAVSLKFTFSSGSLRRSAEPLLLGAAALLPAVLVPLRQMAVFPFNLNAFAVLINALLLYFVLRNHQPTLQTPMSLPVLLQSLDIALAGLTPEGYVVETNPRFALIFGGRLDPRRATFPHTIRGIMKDLKPGCSLEQIERLLSLSTEPFQEPMSLTFPLGDDLDTWCTLGIHPIRVGEALMGYLLQLQDVSEVVRLTSDLKRHEENLQCAHVKLEAAHNELSAAHSELGRYTQKLEEIIQAKAHQLEDKQQQLLHAQKMESLGTLAGGIAHDFNNILFSLIGYSDLIQENSSDPKEVTYCARKIKEGAQRASDLTSKLLGFARLNKPVMQPVSLAEIACDVVELLRRTVEPRIRFELEVPAAHNRVEADAAQLHQVLMNICLNAAEAIAENGEVRVSVLPPVTGSELVESFAEVEPDRCYVELRVEDTGGGMPEEVKPRIFEPFFTTKTKGKGTGLGLSLVYGIVCDHGGFISVQSETGHGTTFRILIPGGDETEPAMPAEKEQAAGESIEGGTAAAGFKVKGSVLGILIIDDNPEVLSLCRRYFGEPLFMVLTAKNKSEAQELLLKHLDEIDVVLMDLIIPDASPEETFQEIHGTKPDISVVLMSGHHADPRISVLLEAGAKGFLRKPFSREDVRAAVRSLLE